MLQNSKYLYKNIIYIGVGLLLILSQCNVEKKSTPFSLELRAGWPQPTIPPNNPLTEESIALGKSLFFDTGLSIDSTISCSSCHHSQHGFADQIALSLGVQGRLGFRNSGTLTNVAFLPYFNRDGGIKSLDLFSAVPIEDHQEMGFNLLAASQRLSQNVHYSKAASQIYDRPFDGFVITRALASYLRTFISDNSLYDQYINKENDASFTVTQKRGMDLFFGPKAQCSSCHSGVLFSDFSFQNNGLKDTYANKDRGRQRITLNEDDEGKFRVASLRNIELTAPYMHDGSIPDLKSVLQHYSSNGSNHAVKNAIIDSIQLTATEEDDIIEFLKTLTDMDFIENPKYRKGAPF